MSPRARFISLLRTHRYAHADTDRGASTQREIQIQMALTFLMLIAVRAGVEIVICVISGGQRDAVAVKDKVLKEQPGS